MFTGAYHGIFDEVIVRGTRKLQEHSGRARHHADGVAERPRARLRHARVAGRSCKARAHELAAVLVEPVQSRRPDFQPRGVPPRAARRSPRSTGIVFIFDEVVTGFRAHPRGAQGLFGIQADLASYGKVVGGGFPIGVIAGKREFMDALDGGHWQFGDDSIPTVGVTYFAGTFVRHPLALAAAVAVLTHVRDAGPALQEALTREDRGHGRRDQRLLQAIGAPFRINTFASLWRNAFTEDLPYGDLIYAMLRDRGIHILDNFPCFLTTAHSNEDVAAIVAAYKAAADEMQASGFFPPRPARRADATATDEGRPEVPSTEPQREVWLAATLSADATLAYNESVSLHLRGELDIGALRAAVRELPARHDALRATFSADGTALRCSDPPALEVPVRDLAALAPEARAAEFAAITARHVAEPFDLATGPLVRAELVRLEPNHHVLVFTAHHIVLDGWSYWVIVKDLGALYALATGARRTPLAAAPSFLDYAAGRAMHDDTTNEQWWVAQFTDGVPALDLPTDRPRPGLRTTSAGREDHLLPPELLAGVKKLGAQLGASTFATLLAAFNVLLHRLTGHTDLVVGIPAAGQNADGLEGLVGHCVNMLPLRNQLARGDRFSDHVRASRTTMLDAYDHQDVTFGRVLQLLPIARDPSRLPLITVIFNIDQALSGEAASLPGVAMELASNPRIHETFELFVNAVDTGAGMRLECQYNSDLFDGQTVRRWLAVFERLLRHVVADPDQSIGAIPLLTDADRQLLAAWNGTDRDYPRETRVEQLVFSTARRVPDRTAVRSGDRTLTYAQLAGRAGAIAAALRVSGVRPMDRVGLLVERDLDLLPAIVGTLAAGAVYVPLDPSFPAERLRFIVQDARLTAVIASGGQAVDWRGVIGELPVVDLDDVPQASDLPDASASPGSAAETAYVIYTSGSTGVPKGVCVPHRAIVNFLAAMRERPGFAERDRSSPSRPCRSTSPCSSSSCRWCAAPRSSWRRARRRPTATRCARCSPTPQ